MFHNDAPSVKRNSFEERLHTHKYFVWNRFNAIGKNATPRTHRAPGVVSGLFSMRAAAASTFEHPLTLDGGPVLALEAPSSIGASAGGRTDRPMVRPYPAELEERVEFHGRELVLRPMRPKDSEEHQRFLGHITADDMRTRFFTTMRELPQRVLAHLTQLDYERDMAFIAVAAVEGGSDEMLGIVHAYNDRDNVEAEIAVLIRSDLKGQRLGALLLSKLIRYCRGRGTQRLVGQALSQNVRMLQLAKTLGFRLTPQGCGLVEMRFALQRNFALTRGRWEIRARDVAST